MAKLEDSQAKGEKETAEEFRKLDIAVGELAKNLGVHGDRAKVARKPWGSSIFTPSRKQRSMWRSYRKRSIELGLRRWTKIQRGGSINKWVPRAEAREFRAPARNLKLPPLREGADRVLDRNLEVLQEEVGAQAAVVLALGVHISKLEKQQAHMLRVAKQANQSSEQDPDARRALGLAVSGLADESKISSAFIDQEIAKGLEDSLHI